MCTMLENVKGVMTWAMVNTFRVVFPILEERQLRIHCSDSE